jgi:transcriptional regulator with XRE-family HTH domain
MGEDGELADRLSRNIKQLRDARGMTQQQMAKLSELPRATWANLESGAGNPTLLVLHKVARALQVSLEELISSPKAACKFYPRATLQVRNRGRVEIRRLLPDEIPGMGIDRMLIPPHAVLTGIPHTPGTREYLTCESGEIILTAAGERWTLSAGDVVVFRGDQRHSYENPQSRPAIGYSVVLLAPAG